MKAIFNKKNLTAIGILMLIGLVIFIFSTEIPTVKQKVYTADTYGSTFKLLRQVACSDALNGYYTVSKSSADKIAEFRRIENAEYMLITSYKDSTNRDFGDFHYIDSIKCIRYNQMLTRAPHIDTLEIEVENLRKRIGNQRKEELEKLNKSCK